MNECKTNSSPTRQIHVSPETYKRLRHIAVDREARLLEVTEEVIAAGFSSIRATSPVVAASKVRSN